MSEPDPSPDPRRSGGAASSAAPSDASGWLRPRGGWPLLATYRVEYKLDGRRMVAFMATLSRTRMVLRSATGLEPGARQIFALVLDGRGDPLEIEGVVLPPEPASPPGGAAVAFDPDDADGNAELARYFGEVVVPRLEKVTASARPHVAKVLDLAGVYYDLGRDDDALALYRRALGVHRRELALFENAAALLLARASVEPDLASLSEIESLVAAGLAVGASETLAALGEACAQLRAALPPGGEEAASDLAAQPSVAGLPDLPQDAPEVPAYLGAADLPGVPQDAPDLPGYLGAADLPGVPQDAPDLPGYLGAADLPDLPQDPDAIGESLPFPATLAGDLALGQLPPPDFAGDGREPAPSPDPFTTVESPPPSFAVQAPDDPWAAIYPRGDELSAGARELEERERALQAEAAAVDERVRAVEAERQRLAEVAGALAEREAELSRRERMLAEQHLELPSIEALRRETAELREVNDTLAHELGRARERLTASGPLDSDALAELQARLQSSEHARAELEHALGMARSAAEEAAERARLREGESLAGAADELAQERAALAGERAQLEALRHEVLQLEAARASLAHERGELEWRREELERFARDIEQTRDLLGQSFASQRLRADELERQAAALASERQELDGQRAAVEAERTSVAALGSQLLAEERMRRQREERLAARPEPASPPQADLEARTAALAERERNLEEGRRALDEVRAAVVSREQQLREERTLVPNLQAALDAERAQLALLRRRASDDAETIRRLEAELTSLQESVKQARPRAKEPTGWHDRGRTYNYLRPSADVPHDSSDVLLAAHRQASAGRRTSEHRWRRSLRRPGVLLASVGGLAFLALVLAFLFGGADARPVGGEQEPVVQSTPADDAGRTAPPRGRAPKRSR